MKDKTPRNAEGQPPTEDREQTVARLEEKKKREHGKANRARTDDQEREVADRP